ncbi:MAG TPA: sigma-70 family RNA polymerase sigma factor [Streptosporangiaceae bacterium]|nr:sigma-70 family RNA polymerase sigma factor [Streptosporangiaceae bacterium]
MAEREEPCVPATKDHQRDAERRFAALYQAYYRPILAYAVRRVAPGEDAADVVADVFTTAWRRIGELPEAPADRLWLYGVAQRVIAGRRRSARRLFHLTARLRADVGTRQPGQLASGQPGPGQPGPGQPGLRDAISDRVVAALDRLSVREREALQLVLWEELSHAEAAQVLGCSANAVAIRVHRAKTRLRRELSATELPATGHPGIERATGHPGIERATGRPGIERGTERPGTEMSEPRPAPETTPTHAWMNRS